VTYRHPIPRLWLLTDERQGAAVLEDVARLPPGAGVVFRHHRTEAEARRALFVAVRAIARRRRLVLVLAASPATARRWRAEGSYGPPRVHAPAGSLRLATAHDPRELMSARAAGAALALLSPVFPTNSHPGAAALGTVRFGLLLRQGRLPVAALGGMNRKRFGTLPRGAWGWAAIDGLARRPRQDQNLKAVPM
jgi:thiamine-phosphate pyrophosphorylase